MNFAASSANAAKKPAVQDPAVAEEVVVLLKWYHTYFQEGKYQQAEQVAEFAHELAPEDPETMAAVEVVRRQRTHMPPPVNVERKNVEQKLDKVLNKLEQLEKLVRELEAQKAQLERQVRVLRAQNQQSSKTLRREPAGSPDRID
jgi:septal ring factor EnvC (AmiA/AmiB activator)